MIKPARPASRLGRLHHWGSVVLRFVLLVSVWQGPIPWFHCHGSLTAAGETQPWLAQHLRSHHSPVSLFANIDFDWHCHFDFPTPSSEDEPQESPKPKLVVSSVGAPASVSLGGEVNLLSSFYRLPVKVTGISPPGLATAGVNQHFYDSFADSLAMPLRFCVAII